MNNSHQNYFESPNGDKFYASKKKITVLRKQQKEIPSTLCKYYSISESHNIDALINNYIYAGHPKQFNDPFDSYPYFFKNTKVNHEIVFRLAKKLNENGNEYSPEQIKIAENDFKKSTDIFDYLTSTRLGIISMTDGRNNNALHWDHYTQNKGFAVKFKTSKLFKQSEVQGPFDIDYDDEITKIDIIDEKNIAAQIIYKSLVKKKCWKTEEEWRFFVSSYLFHPEVYKNKAKIARRIPYDFESIERVILGFYFFKREIDHKAVRENSKDNYLVNLYKVDSFDETQQNKIDLLDYCNEKNIPISIIELNENKFEFTPREIDYSWQNGNFNYQVK